MKMREHLQEIFKVLSNDETIIRLMTYKPENPLDDPLDSAKPNILDMEENQKWAIINDKIKFTKNVQGLTEDGICRLLFYPSLRTPDRRNHLSPTQDIHFDILTHMSFNDVDMRNGWICDRLHELLNDKRISGFGKVKFVRGQELSVPDGYIGYRLTYEFGELE